MTPSGKILLVDDSPDFLDTYRTILATEGYEVDEAHDGAAALTKLEKPGWDLVLLDRKLQGPAGPDTGLDLMQSIRDRAPGVKVIVVTGYADSASVERAFASGAYDYLEKNEYLEAILKAKVRNALEAARERRMAALANGKREEVIRELWKETLSATDKHRKGKLLEDLVALIFKSIPGFERTQTNRSSSDEQIDLLIPNDSPSPFWQQMQSPYILGECKNWSAPVDPKEMDALRQKMERRFSKCRLGFFIAVGGFTKGFGSALQAERKTDTLIVPIDRVQLDELVHSKDRNTKLKEYCDRTVVDASRDS